jgi:hypothetical protein
VIAYKFLGSDCTGRFSGFAWPLPVREAPGVWVEAAPSRCASGVHACRVSDLPFWIDATLWRIELAGPVVEAERKIVAPRGRLLERLASWDSAAMRGFGFACSDRVARFAAAVPRLEAYVTDVRTFAETGKAGVAGFVAARTAEMAGGTAAYDAERAAQTRWLADRLGIEYRGL